MSEERRDIHNINPKSLDGWEAFEEKIQEIENYNSTSKSWENIVFRGQSDAAWNLKTTLERFSDKEFTYDSYLSLIKEYVVNPVYSLTKDKKELEKLADHSYRIPPYPEYMVYSRHHGFPSPLLDCTKSPYVTAFFAFNGVTDEQIKQQGDEGRVAIYTFQPRFPGEGTCNWASAPHIRDIGPNLKTHNRHDVQQCVYAVCVKEEDSGKAIPEEIIYCPFVEAQETVGGNEFKKYTLPASERDKVLNKLDQVNINSSKLFENEEGLMDMMANRLRCQKLL